MHHTSEDIQFLRGIAILLVLIVHWGLGTQIFERLGLINPGWIGVELFFVISGFVVVRSLERSNFDLVYFVIARVFRLYPALLLLLFGSLAVNPILPHITPPEALTYFWTEQKTLLGQSFAILFAFHPSASFGQSYTNNALWSLSREFQFYAVLALVVLSLKITCRDRLFFRKSVLTLTLTVYIAGIFSRGLLYFGTTTWLGNTLMAGKFELMALGMLAGMMPQTFLQAVARHARLATPLLLAGPLVILMLSRDSHSLTGAGDLLESLWMVLIGWAFVLLVIVAEEGLFWPLPAPLRRSMVWLGDRSYTIFLFHFFCFMASYYIAIYVFMPPLGKDWSWAVMQCITSIFIMVPLVEGIYRFVEQPMISIGKRLLRNFRAQTDKTVMLGQQDTVTLRSEVAPGNWTGG